MSEVLVHEPHLRACPSWCANQESQEAHSHVSADVHVETLAQPLTARLVQVAANTEPRVMINGQVATLEQAATFARSIRRLTDQGTPATVGLGFVLRLADGHGITIEELSLASGVQVERLRGHRDGDASLTVHEVDRLALTVVEMASTRNS